MGVFFTAGEKKTRPGVYQRYANTGGAAAAGAVNGIVAIPYRSNWGAIGEVVPISSDQADSIDILLGSGGASNTVEAIKQAFTGGATTVLAVRLGSGGTKATAKIADTTAETPVDAITITAKNAGSRPFRYQVRGVLGDETSKEFDIIEGTTIREKILFPVSDAGEVDALVDAINKNSAYFSAEKAASYSGTGKVKTVAETAITAGTDPTVTNADYSAAFTALEPYRFNTICVDTDEPSVHTLLAAFVERVYKGGKIESFAVMGGLKSKSFTERMTAAKAFNSYNVVYLGGGFWRDSNGVEYDGWKAAARFAGMLAAIPSNQSLVHTSITGAVEPLELLTNAQYEAAIRSGAVAVSTSANGVVWLDSAVTTLVELSGEDDEGWKKIKRSKIRKELMSRVSDTIEPLIGRVNNDTDGQANIIAIVQSGVLDAMAAENKLLSGAYIEADPHNPPQGDSAWFKIYADDIDSVEKAYFTYGFRYSTTA